MARRYIQSVDGEPIVMPAKDGMLLMRVACCDCGLVHDYDFRFSKGQVTRTAWRNVKATAGVRRRMRK